MDRGTGLGIAIARTECYSPTCSVGEPCYSISCPVKYQQRQMTVPPRQKRRTCLKSQTSSLAHALWSTTVAPELLQKVDEREKMRQEIIFELIQTEKEFVCDIQLVNRLYIKPLLQSSTILEESKRESFVRDVFANIKTLGAINRRLLKMLTTKQRESPIVGSIGDVFITVMSDFRAYIEYGTKQVYAKYYLDNELAKNEELVAFLSETERLPESRKLPLQSFLARPTTRLGRYPLLLGQVLKKTSSENDDCKLLPEVMSYIGQVLTRLNSEAGKADNFLRLTKLNQQLLWNVGEYVDLFLLDSNRRLLREGTLLLRKAAASESAVKLFLLDTCLLITKQKKDGYLKVIRRPIPLELFSFQIGQISSWNLFPVQNLTTVQAFRAKRPLELPSLASMTSSILAREASVAEPGNAGKYPFTVNPMGRFGGSLTLLCNSQSERNAWIETLASAKDAIDKKGIVYKSILCIEASFDASVPYLVDVNSQEERLLVPQLLANSLSNEPICMASNSSLSEQLNRSISSLSFSASTQDVGSAILNGGFKSRAATSTSVTSASTSISGSINGFNASNSGISLVANAVLGPAAGQRVHCCLNVGPYLLFGTESGLFATRPEYTNDHSKTVLLKCLDLTKITQMDTFEPAGLLVVLQASNLVTLALDLFLATLNEWFNSSNYSTAGPVHVQLHKKVKRLVSHVSFFKIGTSRNKEFLCTVRSASLTSTIKVFEPVSAASGVSAGSSTVVERGSKSGSDSTRRSSYNSTNVSKFFRIAADSIRLYKEFYIPTESTSLHFLKTKLCVGCTKGFEVIDLDSLSTQGLLDPADLELSFALNKEAVKPIAIFRLQHGLFLLCYNQFGFFVNRMGRRARNEILTFWCGVPIAFAFQPPYILALEPNFVEVRNMDTGELCQIIPGANLRCLSTKGNQLFAVADHGDSQLVFRLARVHDSSPTSKGDSFKLLETDFGELLNEFELSSFGVTNLAGSSAPESGG